MRARSDDRILADAGGEHERIEPAERGRQHAGVKPDAIDEVIERKRGPRIGARLEVAHVVADAGQALQAASRDREGAATSAALMPFWSIR